MVNFELTIGGVDGSTNVILSTSSIKTARKLLAQYDHEGSCVTLRVTAEDGQAYELLDAVAFSFSAKSCVFV